MVLSTTLKEKNMRFVIDLNRPALIVDYRDEFGEYRECMHVISWRRAKQLRKDLDFVLKCEPAPKPDTKE